MGGHAVACGGQSGKLRMAMEILANVGDAEVKQLLSKQNHSGETALYVAAEHGSVDLVKEMMKYYDIGLAGTKAKNGYDAFHVAARQGELGKPLWVLKLLLLTYP